MKPKVLAIWLVTSLANVLLLSSGPSDAQELVLSVHRGTGEANVRNDAAGATEVDGYLIESASGLLNVDGWTSLMGQGVEGWTIANPSAQHLGELNLVGSSGLDGGAAVSLGEAYNGLHVTPSQEDLTFRFTTPDGQVHEGVVEMQGAPRVPILTVDRVSGAVSLGNLSSGSFALDSYAVSSPNGLLVPAGFNGLASQNVEGWSELTSTTESISERQTTGQTTFDVGMSFDLGAAYHAAAGASGAMEDLSVAYSTTEGETLQGIVQYTGPVNDLVLSIDAASGEATIQNLSSHVAPFTVTGYSVLSAGNALSVEGWNSFSKSGAAGEGWIEANPTSSTLAELNGTDAQVFEEGTRLSIGSIFTPGSSQDLSFQYSTLTGVQFGTVEYITGDSLPGDCNGDGVLDAGDLACVQTIEDRDLVLAALNTLPGDLDGNGDVALGDFVVLSANFNTDASSYTEGNIDLMGGVAFADFVVLSTNFGRMPAGGAAAASVPEPAASLLLAMGLLACLHRNRRR